MQLAVTGYLSFVVATDGSDVRLTRTTREEFLRKLVFEIKVNKIEFDQTKLVAFVKNIANTRTTISIQLNLLELLLNEVLSDFAMTAQRYRCRSSNHTFWRLSWFDPEAATKYFDFSDDAFDIATFDIYAELGPDHRVVTNALTALDSSLASIAMSDGEKHILLTNELQPMILKRADRLKVIESKLAAAVGRGQQ